MSGRVLVTGGAKGVGAGIVRALVEAGYDVDFTYRSSGGSGEALVAELRDAHPARSLRADAVDLADKAALEAFCDAIAGEDYFGFVHNAGQSYDALAAMVAQDRAEAAMQVNFWSLVRIAKTVMRSMVRARAGRIVAIGSVAALRGNPGNAAYAATKGAMLSYCRTLAMETARRGITVNTVAPGFVDTDMLAPYAAHREGIERQIPAGRFARPEDVAGLVAFLMSPAGSYITGAVLPVDGGLSAKLAIDRS